MPTRTIFGVPGSITTSGDITLGNPTVLVLHQAVSPVNSAEIDNAATGTNPILLAQGNDATVGWDIKTKGGLILRLVDIASLVNYLQITGRATGTSPDLTFTGTDATVGGTISTKGGIQLKFLDVASLVNFLQFAGTATGTDPTLSVQGDATRGLILSLPGTSALTFRADNVTAIGSPTSGLSKIYLRGTGGQVRYDDTTIMGITEKKGSGGGDYTTTSASYADIDGTNLAYTVTVPTGWKAMITFIGDLVTTIGGNQGVAIADGTTVLKEQAYSVSTSLVSFALMHTFPGDNASHTFKPRWKTSAGTATMSNSTATLTPVLTILLMPSN